MKLRLWLGLGLWLSLCFPAFADKIGFYFGTFDPPHAGHLALAQAAQQELNLDQVYILPNYAPGHKPNASRFQDRRQMVNLLTRKHTGLASVPPTAFFEKVYSKDPANYIGEVISALRQQAGTEHRYYHLVGSDSFNKMVSYGKLPTPTENRIVAVMPREGYVIQWLPEVTAAQQRGQVYQLKAKVKGLSSSWVRKQANQGNWIALKTVLDPEVQAYIRREGLYQQGSDPFRQSQGHGLRVLFALKFVP